MSKFKANVDDLRNANKTLKATSSDLNLLKGELKEIQSVVNAEWTCLAAEQYKQLMAKYLKDVQAIKKTVDELKDYAKDTSEVMEILDKVLDVLTSIFSFS